MPLFSACRYIILGDLVHRVELEVVGQVVHALHLLLSVHLEPLFDIDSQVLALLLEAHLGPFISIVSLWAGWMRIIQGGDLVAATFNFVAHLSAGDTILTGVTAVSNSLVFVIIHFIVVLAAVDFAAIESVLSASLPNLLFCHLIKALLTCWWCLDYALKQPLRDLI